MSGQVLEGALELAGAEVLTAVDMTPGDPQLWYPGLAGASRIAIHESGNAARDVLVVLAASLYDVVDLLSESRCRRCRRRS